MTLKYALAFVLLLMQLNTLAQSCPAGNYWNGSSCVSCPVGNFCRGGMEQPTPCPVGRYQDQTGQQTCKDCLPGTFNGLLGAISCTNCGVGTYNPDIGAASCQSCPSATTEGSATCAPPPAAVPTLSQWGILIFGLSLLAMGLVVVYNVQASRKWVLSGYRDTASHTGINIGRFTLPFDLDKYQVNLLWSGGLSVIGFASIYLIWGKIITDDIIGMSITVPLVAYVLYLMKEK